MHNSHRISFTSILVLLFLLPLFFLPTAILPLGIVKTALIAGFTVVIFLAFLYEGLKAGRLVLPSNYILWGGVALPIVYFFSALSSSSHDLSLFGYNLEIGTFASILLVSVLFLVSATVFSSISRVMEDYGVLVFSFSIVLLLALLKVIFGGDHLVFGALFGMMGNPIGAWTDYAVCFSFLSVMSIFTLEILPLRRSLRIFFYVVLALSLGLLSIINFSIAWDILFTGTLVALVYFFTVEKKINQETGDGQKKKKARFLAPVIVLIVSLFFVLNPTLSSTNGGLGNMISSSFGVLNTDVRPSLSSTLGVASQTMKSNALLGSGPNTFGLDWLLYKPASVNTTGFWNTAFPFGFGFLPTQVASTGIIGVIVWVAFFALYLLLGFKALSKNSRTRNERFATVSSFVGSLFLWIAIFVYIPSISILALTFIFTGMFVGTLVSTGILNTKEIVFGRSLSMNFGAMLLVILFGIGTLAFGFVAFQRISSVLHFEKALSMSNTSGSTLEDIEAELGKATSLSNQDVYYSALSQLEFSRAQAAVSSTTGTPEENKQIFETAMSKSIAGAQTAKDINPSNYTNWVSLGSLYAALVPKPFSIKGAYEGAKAAYAEAEKRNPNGPEISLLNARLEFDQGNIDKARLSLNQALDRKPDYADAYFLLTQIEINQNNISQAIKSAETASLLSPGNAGIFFEVGLLKYSNQDFAGASTAFARALSIVPDYANAKYYLGLSLAELGKTSDAIALFEDLKRSNPDNQGVKDILANLKGGHSAFYKTPETKKPSKTTPPIKTSTAPAQ